MTIEYHPAVEEELRQIRDYYNGASRGLGDKFIAEFDKRVLEISRRPLRWMIVTGDVRRCLMRRFPYLIYFRHSRYRQDYSCEASSSSPQSWARKALTESCSPEGCQTPGR